jgi:hypothetical protein
MYEEGTPEQAHTWRAIWEDIMGVKWEGWVGRDIQAAAGGGATTQRRERWGVLNSEAAPGGGSRAEKYPGISGATPGPQNPWTGMMRVVHQSELLCNASWL